MSELVDKCTQHRHYMAKSPNLAKQICQKLREKDNRGAKYKELIHKSKVTHSKELQIYAKNYVYKHSEVNHGQLWKAQKWINFLFSFEFDKYHLRRVRKDISWYG